MNIISKFRRLTLILLCGIVGIMGCSGGGSGDGPGGGDGNGGGDTNQVDTNGAVDADADADADSSDPFDSDNFKVDAVLWVANSLEGTVSKVDTRALKETARYRTCPQDPEYGYCDPSRTAVNLHGDAVVTNRYISPTRVDIKHPSGVAKFATNKGDCIDRNGNGRIETSSGPTDVLNWDDEECRLWYTELPDRAGARATAWDGTTDPITGKGGNVLIGTCYVGPGDTLPSDSKAENEVYLLDGETGAILDQTKHLKATLNECYYGGSLDYNGRFWVMEGFGFPRYLMSFNASNLTDQTARPLGCGYGISVDSHGRVWTAGRYNGLGPEASCVARFDPAGSGDTINVISENLEGKFLRGLAVGTEVSAGFVWVAENDGLLYKFDESTLELAGTYRIRGEDDGVEDYNGLVGAAIDYDGYVWTVSPIDNAIYRFDPATEQVTKVPVGTYPYTYSDMTGMQLKAAVVIQ